MLMVTTFIAWTVIDAGASVLASGSWSRCVSGLVLGAVVERV